MPKLQIDKTITVNAPAKEVFSHINDLKEWTKWSPWLIMEDGVTVDVANQGKSYSWNGKRVGSGSMEITAEEPDKSVDYNLQFLTPWKSQAKVRFELTPKNGQTDVTWLMESKLPFYLFWMKKMMTSFVGMDYQRGLYLLKDLVEDGEVHSKLDFKGITSFTGCNYIGIRTECALNELGPSMSDDFKKLFAFLEDENLSPAGNSFSIYHKWDMVNGKASYTVAVPVEDTPPNLPEVFVAGKLPGTATYKLRHTGPYLHLGNAWTTLYSMHRNKEFKLNKKIDPFEVYINTPGKVPDTELITDVLFPVK